MVVAVHPDSVAARADIRVGDLIETVNDRPSLDVDWKKHLPGDAQPELSFGVVRDGKRIVLKLRPPAPQK
jgi:C-terminal processing protease CtpA/Prc